MPETLAHLLKECILKYNEKIYCKNNNQLVCDTILTCPKTKHEDMPEKTFYEENDCKDKLTDTDLDEITDESNKSSSDDKCTCINKESSSQLDQFNEEQCVFRHPCENNFGFQCRQWLETSEKDLFLSTAFVAQSIRRKKQTVHRDDLCYQWLNSTDKELFLNTAFAAKSSRRGHTRYNCSCGINK